MSQTDYCLCTMAACLNDVGTPTCDAPEVPGTAHPPAPTGTKVSIQTGQAVKALNGSSVTYNGTVDAGISTQYIDAWNYQRV